MVVIKRQPIHLLSTFAVLSLYCLAFIFALASTAGLGLVAIGEQNTCYDPCLVGVALSADLVFSWCASHATAKRLAGRIRRSRHVAEEASAAQRRILLAIVRGEPPHVAATRYAAETLIDRRLLEFLHLDVEG